jgi:hypothetical protein
VKTILSSLILVFSVNSISLAQSDEKEKPAPRFDLKVSAGATLTFVPDFDNWTVLVPDGIVVPYIYRVENSKAAPITSESEVSAKPRLGWNVDAQVTYQLPNDFALSLSVGAKKLRYDLETTFWNTAYPFFTTPRNLDDINPSFGETALTYLLLEPGISRSYLRNKLTVEVGPSFNFLLKEKINNVLLTYEKGSEPNPGSPDQIYFDNMAQASSLMVGCHVAVSYRVIEFLEVKAATQFLNSSVYNEGEYVKSADNVSPAFVQLGASFLPFHLKDFR